MSKTKVETDKLFEIFSDILKRDPFLSRDVAMQAAIAVYSKAKDDPSINLHENKPPTILKKRVIPDFVPNSGASATNLSHVNDAPQRWNINFDKKPKMYSKFDQDFDYNPRECDYCHGEDCGDGCVNFDIDDGYF